MAIDAANNSPPSRSYFQKSVSLQDWWLTKPETYDDRKRIGVSGFTCTSQLSRAERCFSSAPILKAYDFFELETVDGICVILQGYINKEKTLQSGFSSEVFDHFVIGFPSYWEEFCTSCPKRGSSDECVSRENEDVKDSIGNFDDTCTINTEVGDCKDKERIMKGGDEVLFKRPPLTSETTEDVVGNNSFLKKKSKMDGCEWLGRRTTRSMTKMDSSKNHRANLERVSFVDSENFDTARKDKDDASKREENDQYVQRNKSTSQESKDGEAMIEPQIESMRSGVETKRLKVETSSDPLRIRSMRGSQHNTTRDTARRGKEGAGASVRRESKRKLTFESSGAKRRHITTPTSTSIPKTNKGQNILSPESLSGKRSRSRSGRVLLPSLEFWRNQTVVYDAGLDRQVTGVRDVA